MNPKMKFNPTIPVYVNGKFDSYVLVKFFDSEEHRRYFLEGKLYMRSQIDFIKSEIGNGRADITEGAEMVVYRRNDESYPDIRFEEHNGDCYTIIVEYKKRPEGYRENQGFISYPLVNQKRNIFCMYTLWINSIANKHKDICKEELRNFGEYGVVITDINQFLRRVGIAINQDTSVSDAECGFVNYIQKKNIMEMNPFLKPETYIMQHEFRICTDTDNTDLLELPVESGFKDISIPIKLDDFVESIKCSEGIISFKADKEMC